MTDFVVSQQTIHLRGTARLTFRRPKYVVHGRAMIMAKVGGHNSAAALDSVMARAKAELL